MAGWEIQLVCNAGGEAAEGRLAATEHPGELPVGFHIEVAGAGLHLVDAVGAGGVVAGDVGAKPGFNSKSV